MVKCKSIIPDKAKVTEEAQLLRGQLPHGVKKAIAAASPAGSYRRRGDAKNSWYWLGCGFPRLTLAPASADFCLGTYPAVKKGKLAESLLAKHGEKTRALFSFKQL